MFYKFLKNFLMMFACSAALILFVLFLFWVIPKLAMLIGLEMTVVTIGLIVIGLFAYVMAFEGCDF